MVLSQTNQNCGGGSRNEKFEASLQKLKKMSKQKNHKADIKNPNKGTSGTNQTYNKNQGNRGKQLNPNQGKKGK